jgi:thiamine-monophosphate kinase
VREGVALRGIATAAMDTSDGLVATLDQLARLNEARFVVEDPAAVVDPRADGLLRALSLPPLALLGGHHGEFEVVFTVPEARRADLATAAAAIGWTPVRLGRVEAGSGVTFGGMEVDGARFRNLLHDVGDPHAYVREFLRLVGETR